MMLFNIVRRADGAVYSHDKHGRVAGFGLGGDPVAMTPEVADKLLDAVTVEGRGAYEIREVAHA
jgi:hypothetical protein